MYNGLKKIPTSVVLTRLATSLTSSSGYEHKNLGEPLKSVDVLAEFTLECLSNSYVPDILSKCTLSDSIDEIMKSLK